MADKFLKIFLVNRVQESYFINFFILLTVFAFSKYERIWNGLASAVSSNGLEDVIYLVLGAGILIAFISFCLYLFITEKNNDLTPEIVPYLLIILNFLLMGISIASFWDTQATELTFQVTLILILLFRYFIKTVIIFVYVVLGRFADNRIYQAIHNRMITSLDEEQVGRYQQYISAAVALVAYWGLLIYDSNMNGNVKFLIIFSFMNSVSYLIQKINTATATNAN